MIPLSIIQKRCKMQENETTLELPDDIWNEFMRHHFEIVDRHQSQQVENPPS